MVQTKFNGVVLKITNFITYICEFRNY